MPRCCRPPRPTGSTPITPRCSTSWRRGWTGRNATGSRPPVPGSTAAPLPLPPEAGVTDARSRAPLGDFRVRETVLVRFNAIDGQNILFNGHYLPCSHLDVAEHFRPLGRGQPGPFLYP